jgi:hypothetical protein
MKKSRINCLTIFCILFGVALLQSGAGQEAAVLEISDAAICRNVENLTCVDPGEEFSAQVEKLYFFTRVNGAPGDTEITHVWYYGDTERFRINLAVRSSSWRTYSSKKIQAHETGSWHVEAIDRDGTILRSISFKIVP